MDILLVQVFAYLQSASQAVTPSIINWSVTNPNPGANGFKPNGLQYNFIQNNNLTIKRVIQATAKVPFKNCTALQSFAYTNHTGLDVETIARPAVHKPPPYHQYNTSTMGCC